MSQAKKAEINEDEEVIQKENQDEVLVTENEELIEEDVLVVQIKELEQKVKEYEELAKRKVADFDNFRRRVNKEKDQLTSMMADKVILDFMQVADNLERAIDNAENNKDFDGFLQGVISIQDIFNNILEKYSVKKIDSTGKDFDPKIHQALHTVEGDYEKQIVIEEVEKALVRNEKVLRVAKVAVGIPTKKEEAVKQEEQDKKEESTIEEDRVSE